jgi:hypothetical protein
MSTDERNERAYRAVSGRSPRTEPKPAPTTLDFHGSLNLLYARIKSQNRLAEVLGVPRRTLRRWLAGETPSRTGPDRVRRETIENSAKAIIRRDDHAALQAQRRSRLTPAKERKARGAQAIEVKGTLRYDGDKRTIKFMVGASDGLDSGVPDAIVDAFLDGASADDGAHVQNEGLFAPVAYGMLDEWYRDAFLDRERDALGFDVENVRFL